MRRDGVILDRCRSAPAVVDRMVLQDLTLVDQLLVCRQLLWSIIATVVVSDGIPTLPCLYILFPQKDAAAESSDIP